MFDVIKLNAQNCLSLLNDLWNKIWANQVYSSTGCPSEKQSNKTNINVSLSYTYIATLDVLLVVAVVVVHLFYHLYPGHLQLHDLNYMFFFLVFTIYKLSLLIFLDSTYCSVGLSFFYL